MADQRTPLVELKNISISFGGIHAVDNASVDLYPGEVVALLGHNGAGKSTLIKLLAGLHQPDGGRVEIEGQTFDRLTPHL
ncbi:ATP-binding cassette domain-containing protein, partial [Rhizobium ruizarguesonis]